MSDLKEIESVLFKRVPGGYVYQAPNPWVFGRGERYLVNEDQKAQILGVVAPRRPWLRVLGLMVALTLIAAGSASLVWAISPHEDPTALDVLAMTVLMLGQCYLALVLAVQRKLRRLQPITAGLPRTEERITARELRRSLNDAISLRRALLLGIAWSASCMLQCVSLAIRNGHHPLFSDVQSYMSLFVAALSLFLAAKYLTLAVHKARRSEVLV